MPKAKHHISPAIRGAFLESLKVIQRRTGKPFSEILADKLMEDLLGTLNAVSKFDVREKEITVTLLDEVREIADDELTRRIRELERAAGILPLTSRDGEETEAESPPRLLS